MARGKQTCKILKEIRRQIAEANDIEFVTSECRYKGDCLGTCPKCEAEVRFLEQQLRARTIAGKAVAIAGISATALSMLIPMTSEARIPQTQEEPVKESVFSIAKDTTWLKGTVIDEDSAKGYYCEKGPIVAASVRNLRTRSGVATDSNGNFNLKAAVGDSIEVSYIAYQSQKFVVTPEMLQRPIRISLKCDTSAILDGMMPIYLPPIGPDEPLLYLYPIDEKGNQIDIDDEFFYISKIYTDEKGIKHEEPLLSAGYFSEKNALMFYWDHDPAFKDANGKPLKEVTLRIEADSYEKPVTVKIKYRKGNINKTIKFKH